MLLRKAPRNVGKAPSEGWRSKREYFWLQVGGGEVKEPGKELVGGDFVGNGRRVKGVCKANGIPQLLRGPNTPWSVFHYLVLD
jgi:hypothetical protein